MGVRGLGGERKDEWLNSELMASCSTPNNRSGVCGGLCSDPLFLPSRVLPVRASDRARSRPQRVPENVGVVHILGLNATDIAVAAAHLILFIFTIDTLISF